VRQSRLLDVISAAMAAGANGKVPTMPSPSSGAKHPAGDGIEHRILVAEDQQVNWMLVERMLNKRGASAVNAADGHQALEMLAAEHYDLVLMDCQMPGLDGYDTASEIRRREAAENRTRVPIIAMTANAMFGDRERCLEAGMDDYVAKPITLDVLDETLDRWLPSTPADAPVLEPARLAELRTIFPGEELTTMLQDLAAAIASDVDQIDAAAAEGDRATLAAAAHRLKNSAGMIGATALAQAAARLDGHGKNGHADVEPGESFPVQALFEQWKVTRAALEDELSIHEQKSRD
jgi:CheY-like chemotaxis protein